MLTPGTWARELGAQGYLCCQWWAQGLWIASERQTGDRSSEDCVVCPSLGLSVAVCQRGTRSPPCGWWG